MRHQFVRRHQQAQHQEQHDVREPGETFIEFGIPGGRDTGRANDHAGQVTAMKPPVSSTCASPTVPTERQHQNHCGVGFDRDQSQ